MAPYRPHTEPRSPTIHIYMCVYVYRTSPLTLYATTSSPPMGFARRPPRATSTSHDDDLDVDFDFDFDFDEHVGGRRRWVTSAERRGTTTSSGDDINGAGTETIDIDGARGQERLRPAASSRATGGGDERGRARVWCVTRCDARMVGFCVRVFVARVGDGGRARAKRTSGRTRVLARRRRRRSGRVNPCLSVCLRATTIMYDGGVSRGCVVRWRLRPWCVGDGSDDDADARRACTGRVGVYDETARRMSD